MSPERQEILSAYPDQEAHLASIGKTFVDLYSGSDCPDPQEVPDAIMSILKQPAGQRSLRVVVDPDTGHIISGLNTESARYEKEGLKAFGMGNFAVD